MVDKEIEHLRSKAPEAKKPRTAKTQEDVAGTLRAILKLADRTSLLSLHGSCGPKGLVPPCDCLLDEIREWRPPHSRSVRADADTCVLS